MRGQSYPFARGLAYAACAGLALPMPASAGTPPCDPIAIRQSGSDARCPNAQRPPNSEDSSFAEAGAAVLAAAIVVVIFCAIIGCGNNLPGPGELKKNGPRLGKDKYKMGRFPVRGFVQSGWPMVVEFQSEDNSFTWVEIATADKRSAVVWLDTSGVGGLYQAKVDIPEELRAREPTPAKLVVRSGRVRDGMLLRNGKEPVPSQLDVIGIGAGPGAIGSVAVNRLSFRQAGSQPGGDFADFGFFAAKPFNRATASVIRFRPKGGEIREDIVRTYEKGPVTEGAGGRGQWDGLGKNGQLTQGVHRLQVRAWKDSVEDLSWVGTVSRDRVRIP